MGKYSCDCGGGGELFYVEARSIRFFSYILDNEGEIIDESDDGMTESEITSDDVFCESCMEVVGTYE